MFLLGLSGGAAFAADAVIIVALFIWARRVPVPSKANYAVVGICWVFCLDGVFWLSKWLGQSSSAALTSVLCAVVTTAVLFWSVPRPAVQGRTKVSPEPTKGGRPDGETSGVGGSSENEGGAGAPSAESIEFERDEARLEYAILLQEVLADLSHELKQPLHAIMNFASATGRVIESSGEFREAAGWTEQICEATTETDTSIKRARDLSRFRVPERGVVCLSSAVETGVRRFEARSGMAVERELPRPGPEVVGDATTFAVFVAFLLAERAARAGPGSRASVRVHSDDHNAHLTVSDLSIDSFSPRARGGTLERLAEGGERTSVVLAPLLLALGGSVEEAESSLYFSFPRQGT